jgi:hypothetical protein
MPIHESDIAEERWESARWSHYELWEKLELRLRRRKLLWISATVVVFLALSSVPIILDRAPKWTAMSLSRRLAQLINGMKTEASVRHSPHRIRFAAGGALDYEIEKIASCDDPKPGAVIRAGTLQPERGEAFVLVTPEQAPVLELPGVVSSYCYDPTAGSSPAAAGKALVGFGIVAAKDLTEKRSDRLSVLLIQGASGELAFD